MKLIMQLDREVTPLVNGFLTVEVMNSQAAVSYIDDFIKNGKWINNAYYPPAALLTARKEP